MAKFDWVSWTLSKTQSRELLGSERIQSLWGGYGELLRLRLRGGSASSVILKRIVPPAQARESVSDRRKRRSYEVEQAWYSGASGRCDESCRVALCYAIEKDGEASYLLLEDLGEAGYHPHRPPRREHLEWGLRWLANLHARYLDARPEGLWEQGGYWHLETRPDEWQRMPEGPLKEAAGALDLALRRARFQTVMHGDAKPSNFCWGERDAAAVDFQYVGAGCGIRDVAYFLDCCLDDAGCAAAGEAYLGVYFAALRSALQREGKEASADALETEWRALFPVAWSDFQRFYQGWGQPGPLGSFSRRQLDSALARL